jgi:sigma-B regulation protein RsbU (phosphoserine phosphatase)
MARRSLSIRYKLIIVSTLLLVVVIGLFGAMNSMQSRRIIDDFSKKLQEKTSETLRRSGTVQLRLLAETTRVALVQRDYSTLQATIKNVAKQGKGAITAVAAVDKDGTVLAHNNPSQTGKKARGLLSRTVSSDEVEVIPSTDVEGRRSMAFAAAVKHGTVQLATVFLAYSLEPVDRELKTTAEKKKREIRASLRNTMIVGILAVLIGVVLTIFQGIRLSRPLMALARQADRIAKGDLEARVPVESADEVGALGERFNFMAEQMTLLMRETTAKATMEKELELASTVQATLVPDASVAELRGFMVAGYFKPATECGGDWWGYYRLARDRSLVMIGDVTGHGVGAAMITAAAQGAVTTHIDLTDGDVDLKDLLRAIGASIHATAKGRFLMTCFASLYDPETRTLQFANAGHNFPYIYDASTKNLSSLVIRGNRLGEQVGLEHQVGEVQLRPSDAVFWYTDGIIECENMQGEEYGERRFRAEILQHADLPPDLSLNLIIGGASQFYAQAPQKDDITVVVGKFT